MTTTTARHAHTAFMPDEPMCLHAWHLVDLPAVLLEAWWQDAAEPVVAHLLDVWSESDAVQLIVAADIAQGRVPFWAIPLPRA